jgi:hypothetical protein
MAEPLRKLDNDQDQPKDQNWGFVDETTPSAAGVGYKSPLARARSSWGTAEVIDGDGDGQDTGDIMNQQDLRDAESNSQPIENNDIKDKSTKQRHSDIKNNELNSTPSQSTNDIPYSKESEKSKSKRSLKGLASKRAKLAIIGIIVSAAMSILAFFGALPLKLVHMGENLQDRFFSMGQSAVEARGERMLGRYLRKYVIPDLGADCPSTRASKSCVRAIAGDTPASRMFRGWKESRLENRLATQYGIEFYKEGGRPKMKMAGIPDGVDITDFANGDVGDDLFESKEIKSRKEIRRAFKASIEDETGAKKIWLRFKVGSLLENKYGIKRCTFACDKRDDFTDWKDNKKSAFRRVVANRVIKNTDKTYAMVISCVIAGDCHDRGDGDKIKDTKIEGDVNDVLQKRLAELDSETVEKILKYSDDLIDKGFMKFAIEEIIKKVFKESVQKGALSAIPVVGWIIFAVKVLDAIQQGPKVIAAARFAILASTMVPFFYLLLSHAGEIKSGRVDPEIIEGAMETLQPSESDLQGAEVSPLYNTIMGGESPAVSFFNGTVYAAGDNSESATTQEMECADGKKIKPPRQVCEEDTLGVNSDLLASIVKFFNFLGPIGDLIHIVNKIIGYLDELAGKPIGWLLDLVPGLDGLVSLMTSKLGDVMQWFLITFLHFLDMDSMSGARAFNTAAGGGAVSGVESAKNGVGGATMTKQQVVDASQEIHDQELYKFKQKSFYARMFDSDSPRSFVSQTALLMPGNKYRARETMMAFVTNPFDVFKTTAIASVSNNALASSKSYGEQTYKGFEAFDMLPVGISVDDPVMENDPEDEALYGEEACKAEEERWLDKDNYDIDGEDGEVPMTYFAYPKTVNRCRLEKTAACAMGAMYAEKISEVCEEGDQSGGGGSSDDSSDDSIDPNIDPTEDTSDQPCPAGTEDGGVHQDYGPNKTAGARIRICGIPGAIPASAGVNSSAAANALSMINAAKAEGITLTGSAFRSYDRQVQLRKSHCGSSDYAIYQMSANSCRPPTAKPGNSMHEVGLAIDFSKYSFSWLSKNAGKYGFKNLPSESWHWSTNGS